VQGVGAGASGRRQPLAQQGGPVRAAVTTRRRP
jgi:hypothetical protein